MLGGRFFLSTLALIYIQYSERGAHQIRKRILVVYFHFIKRTKMAASPLISKTSFHVRSISLPSIPHPIADQLEIQLCRLRSSQTASTSSASSLSHRISGLKDLYDCVDELLLLPINEQTLSQDRQSKWVNATLDESLRLMDVCSTARDVLLQTQEHIQSIQSVLRRRCSGELSISNEVAQYLKARKIVKKAIKNCLRGMKKDDKSNEANALEVMLSNVVEVTADIFKSLLIHIAGSMTKSKKSTWSLVSTLIHQNGDLEETFSQSEFEDLDATFSSLICQKKKTGINMMQVDNLRSQMLKLESEIEDLDEALESLFRRLVKTRTTHLNILSH